MFLNRHLDLPELANVLDADRDEKRWEICLVGQESGVIATFGPVSLNEAVMYAAMFWVDRRDPGFELHLEPVGQDDEAEDEAEVLEPVAVA
jgi:hypothetical protein